MAEKIEVGPQEGPQRKFLQCAADVCIFGGSAGGGKSYALLLEAVRRWKVSGFSAVLFRRTYPQISAPGAMWDQSIRLYPLFSGQPSVSDSSWRFPSGAKIKFAHLQHATSVMDWHGSEICLLGFDELTQFEESQFWYLFSRNRSTCGVRPLVRATCNPDADNWVASLLEWWIDQETGLPIPDRAGVLRWFVRVNDQLQWANSKEELLAIHPEIPPKSLTFIPAKLSDNPALLSADPGYLANLLALPMVERERLLGGNWKIRPSAGLIFHRDWFTIVPPGVIDPAWPTVRGWDKAGTEAGGDYTAGVKMCRSWEGQFFVLDVVRGRWGAMERNHRILETARRDGVACAIWLEQEPGSGGKESGEISVRQLAGFNVHLERVTGDKVTRASPFAAQCEACNVFLTRASGPDWIPAFLDELHGFPERPRDDQVDSASLAFNKLAMTATDEWVVERNPDNVNEVYKLFGHGVFVDDSPPF